MTFAVSSDHLSDCHTADDIPARPRKSYGIIYGYRARLREEWRRFLTENFRSPGHVADCFQVSASTAEKWWKGSHAPSGFAMGLAFSIMPDAARARLGVRL